MYRCRPEHFLHVSCGVAYISVALEVTILRVRSGIDWPTHLTLYRQKNYLLHACWMRKYIYRCKMKDDALQMPALLVSAATVPVTTSEQALEPVCKRTFETLICQYRLSICVATRCMSICRSYRLFKPLIHYICNVYMCWCNPLWQHILHWYWGRFSWLFSQWHWNA